MGRLLALAPAPPAPTVPAMLEEPPSLTLDDLQGLQDELLESTPPVAHLDLAAEPHLDLAAEPHLDLAAEPHLNLAAEPHLDLAAEPHLRLAAEPHLRLAAEPHLNLAAEPHLNQAAEPHQDLAAEPDLDFAAEPDLIPPPPPEPEKEAGAGSHFASARDAIEKLMGEATPAPAGPQRLGGRNAMDLEATLSALDTTLGGAAPGPAPAPAPVQPKADTASTVKLTTAEIKVAIAAAKPAEPTEPIKVRPEFQPKVDVPPAPPAAAQNPDLLKIQLEQETCNNVTLEQMATWIEQGRVQEYHMVARQYSDHWIEASKVPALRPVFDRVRRTRGPVLDALPVPAPEAPPAKRGLFGGLFGRN